jgi:L-alanine-DL-glutamate epimerase-like enolase superfamily enzyme
MRPAAARACRRWPEVRIVGCRVAAVAAPFPSPLRFSEAPLTTNTAVIALLEEAGGTVGFGYAPTFGFGTSALRALVADDLGPRLTALEMSGAVDALSDLGRDAWIAGRPAGLLPGAIAILEMALLDLEAKLADQPLYELWNQANEPVRAYASGGWRHLPLGELIDLVRGWRDSGFEAVKIQVGLGFDEDVRRLEAVRDAVGPDVAVMVDANQRLAVETAAARAEALRPFNPAWLEEPIRADLHPELASLRGSSSVAIAAGESETELGELRDLIRLDAVDVIQPDVHRVGLTGTRTIRDEAIECGLTVAPHLAHEVSAHVMSGFASSGWLEYFDWFEDWWDSPVVHRDGRVAPAARAGHGLQLRTGWLEAHAI